MGLTPWHEVSSPREDLRRKEPLDAAQFAIHLDQVVRGDAPPDYAEAERFLSRTFITEGLSRFTIEVFRRLSGERQAANAVHNLVTQFGGGKTHALTLLYHLARLGSSAHALPGISELLDRARLDQLPDRTAVAVFVGTEWDAVAGRGDNGDPHRRTPWGDIAFQLSEQTGDKSLFDIVVEQDQARIRPGKDVIRRFLPDDRPVLILMDEVMNFMTAARGLTVGRSTLASQFYEFVHSLTEEADAQEHLVLVMSLPKSEQEMSAEDEQDFRRLAHITTRVAEPYVLSRDLEIPEIVRRRLFDDVGDQREIARSAKAFGRWVKDHRDMLPAWFPIDRAEETFEATYPFHSIVLSVFERKWQSLPSFQRTRGILRLLAQWVADGYEDGYRGRHSDALITLGTAPLDEQSIRTGVLDQLGEERLEAAILTDIAGPEAWAPRLDEEAEDTLRKGRIHSKVATAVFFESSGGQVKQEATLPEVRLAVGEPDTDIGNVETALQALEDACHYLRAQGTRYWFSTRANLNKLLSDRRSALDPADVEEEARAAIRRVFTERRGVERALEASFFPQESHQIDDVPSTRLVVLAPDRAMSDDTRGFIQDSMSYKGGASRRFKNALVWVVPDGAEVAKLLDAARRLLAWESIESEAGERDFDDADRAQLRQQKERARLDLQEAVWRAYRHLLFLGADGTLKEQDLGLAHSSSAGSMQAFIQGRLRQHDELTDYLPASRLRQNWPKNSVEWSLKSIRDAVYSSPIFVRLTNVEAIKEAVADGVKEGLFGYAAKSDTDYVGIRFREDIGPGSVEFTNDVVLVVESLAEQLKEAKPSPEAPVSGVEETPSESESDGGTSDVSPPATGLKVSSLAWAGEVPYQKWTSLYTKVLQRFVAEGELTIRVEFEARREGGIYEERVDQTKEALRDLGLSGDVEVDGRPDESPSA